MDFKTFLDKLRTHLTGATTVQPEIKIDFDSYDWQVEEALKALWEKFEAEFKESFIDEKVHTWSDQIQTKATLSFGGLKINVEGPRSKNPEYKPVRDTPESPTERANSQIDEWLRHSGGILDNASPSKLRALLTMVQNALGYDTLIRPDVELINAVNSLTLSLIKTNPKAAS